MYAHRRLDVWRWEPTPAEDCYSVKITRSGNSVLGIRPERITRVDEHVMYWRKANHIHSWFVRNVQDGTDDCRSYYVPEDALRELLDACEEVIRASKLIDGTVNDGIVYNKENPKGLAQRRSGKVIEDATVAKLLLPTQEGFFFGTYEYDEDYLNDVVDTRDWIISMLADSRNGTPGDIYYSSGW